MPKIVDHDEKRKVIAKKATTIFAKNSFEAATIQKIASEAGIAKGLIYKYFKSKDEILHYIIMSYLKDFFLILERSDAQLIEPEDRLRNAFFQFINSIEFLEEVSLIFLEVWSYNIKGKHHQINAEIDRYLDLYREKITEIICLGQDKKIFKKTIDGHSLSVFLVASLDGILVHYFHNKSSFNLKQVSTEFFDTFIDGMKSDTSEP